ncbi:lytic transglycosylase [Enterobacter roggenkampii]|uniref:lytic transglycosylase n=1 Tax=Enterobacter roggenkampii TaxID=1812935 RepID=UPI0018EC5792|nr:lytic transglycosylase [Enterobacter roggenkampii]EKU9176997.1 lytic transglycosylase [Enterobacter roggenkampii MGH 34]ELN9573302.1 lytic transglycosylase [Enterobacter roggenkampii]MBJ6582865.1 lytic transglycosylase [Enterobacter roggenkampii]HBM0948091.1 lytic transglycosylase [Enterobacter roggenkampii]HBM0967882.1 lytic transglycosylase [Enterobacter roggenkampii]
MAIKIPVSAQFDAADLKQQIQMVNDQIRVLASQVGQANKQKFEPINLRSKDDLNAFIKQMQKLLSIQTELKQTMGKTGQGATNPLMADWSKMYTDQAVRIKKMQSMLQFLGVEFNDQPAPKPKPPAPTPSNPSPAPHRRPQNNNQPPAWQNHLSTMLRNAGPVGGTISGAMNAGLSGGAGAGLMGLVGGIAALGVGKIIGAVADKIGQAQDNVIGLDKLYRQVGGIVSFSSLQRGVMSTANRLGMTNGDAIALASTYSRAANIQPGQNLGTGMLVSGGLARSYGLDPNSVAGTIGQLSASRVVNNDQQLRRMGLLMGEAIGKSGAFAQAGEAMQAISDFATQQARMSLTAPNVPGYAGAMAGLMSSGIPGMDLLGSTNLLGRVNANLQRGGAMGDPSRAFMARMALRNGINNPMALEVLQSGGAFGTISSTLGPDSLYGQRFGGSYHGDQTLLDMTRQGIHRAYGYGPDSVVALSRHLGVGINDALAIDQMSSADMSGVSDRLRRLKINPDSVNATSYAALGQIQSGKGLEVMGNEYLKRGALDAGERQRLTDALKGTDPEKLKEVLTQVAATHGPAKTEGSEIRDNVAKLNNQFEDYARRALPALDVMRMALVKMTGGSEDSLRRDYEKGMRLDTQQQARRKYGWRLDAYQQEMNTLQDKGVGMQTIGPEGDRYRALKRQQQLMRQQQLNFVEQGNANAHAAAYGPQTAGEAALGGNISSPSAAAAGSGAAGNWAAGNVGNLKDTQGNWRRFPTQQAGIAASAGQLLRYSTGAFKGGRKRTLREIVATYAAGDPEVPRYIQQASKWTGFDPDQELDLRDQDTLKRVTAAVLRKENTKNTRLPVSTVEAGINDALRNSFNYSADRGQLNVNGGQMEIVVKDQRGNVLQTQQQPVTASFQQSRSWANRNR